MKAFLYGWIRDIAFYTILMTVVLHLLPEESQKKYVRFFMGIVLMLVVLSPLLVGGGSVRYPGRDLRGADLRRRSFRTLCGGRRSWNRPTSGRSNRAEQELTGDGIGKSRRRRRRSRMESQTSKWKSDWMSKLKKPKKEQLVVLLLFGVLLVVIAIPTTPGKTTAGGESETISGAEAATDDIEAAGLSYEEQLEKRLSAILSRVAGAGRVEVMVTLESRGERIVEKDTPESRQKTWRRRTQTAAAAPPTSRIGARRRSIMRTEAAAKAPM